MSDKKYKDIALLFLNKKIFFIYDFPCPAIITVLK